MDKKEIIENIKNILATEFEVDKNKISSENNIREILNLDSLDYVDLVVVIEENFGFKINAEDFKNIITFSDFYNMVEKKMSVLAK